MRTIYVGNLPFEASEQDVQDLFGQYGEVAKVSLVNDRETGSPRGFGFVEMSPEQASTAIDALDGADYGGRNLRVNEARDKGARPPRREW
jgi:RNA recognition motif-containing protein